jgi:4-aminobutyrate--pyruvate transaminase
MTRPNSAAARDQAYHLHPYTNLRTLERDGPLVISRGEGAFVYDEQGRRYIEGLAGLWCTALGFSEQRLVDAATRQLSTLPYYHSFAAKVPEVLTDLSEALIAIAPAPLARVIFSQSGSEANDTAIKIVWYYQNALGRPEKKKILARRGGYHGVTIASASLTGQAYAQDGFDLPRPWAVHVARPHFWRDALPHESEAEFTARLVLDLEETIEREGADTIGAFIAEPVMGAGGVMLPPKGYFEAVQTVLKRHEILFIADEVICGFGRTGRMFGSETYGIAPDIMTVAKALTSGYQPMSATLVSDQVYQGLADAEAGKRRGVFGHGYTYSGHPVPAAVAVETLKIYAERDIASVVRGLSPALLDGLARRAGGHPIVGDVRGVGLIAGVELARDPAAKTAFDPALGIGARVVRRAQELGVILRPLPGDVVAFCPPFVIDEPTIAEMIDRFGQALDETHAALKADGLA